MPCKSFVAISAESCWAKVGPVDVGWSTEGDAVQTDSVVCHFQESEHEL